MRLLIVASADQAGELAASLGERGPCDVVDPDLGAASTPADPGISEQDATRLASAGDVVLVYAELLAGRPALCDWLVAEWTRGVALLLVVPGVDDLEHVDSRVVELAEDFALDSASQHELWVRAERASHHRAHHLATASEIADAGVRRAFASRVIQAQEAERHLLSRELHDGVGQMLMVHMMEADLLAAGAKTGPLHELAETLCASLKGTLETVRDLAMDLRPPAIDELGITAAMGSLVNTLARRSGLRCTYKADEIGKGLSADVKVALYRIAQAALDNAARHARCNHIEVRLERIGSGLQLLVIDDGIGFDLKRESSSTWLGLVGMRERADAIGGHVTVDSTIDRGTIVTVVVPEMLE